MPCINLPETGASADVTSGASDNALSQLNNWTIAALAVGATGGVGSVALTTAALPGQMLSLGAIGGALAYAGHRVDQDLPIIPKGDKQQVKSEPKIVETTATAA
mgnify:CR=1 FL=1